VHSGLSRSHGVVSLALAAQPSPAHLKALDGRSRRRGPELFENLQPLIAVYSGVVPYVCGGPQIVLLGAFQQRFNRPVMNN
jgi:hypothetical protein